MYLSVEKEIEIEKSIDVLRSQNWDLLIVRGYETFVNFYARQGFEEFKSLENDIANGYAHYYDSVEVSSGKVGFYMFSLLLNLCHGNFFQWLLKQEKLWTLGRKIYQFDVNYFLKKLEALKKSKFINVDYIILRKPELEKGKEKSE